MNHAEWRDRIIHRNDISSRITHLTNGDTADDAFETLMKILEEKKLVAPDELNGDEEFYLEVSNTLEEYKKELVQLIQNH